MYRRVKKRSVVFKVNRRLRYPEKTYCIEGLTERGRMDVKDVAQETCSRIALLGPAALSLQCMISVLYNSVLYIFSTC